VPFTIDESEFRFRPRIQRINTLEATTRVKLCFYDRLFWFWHLQGVDRRYPRVEKRLIDLYYLHQLVKEDDGLDHCNVMRKWPRIAEKMGFTSKFLFIYLFIFSFFHYSFFLQLIFFFFFLIENSGSTLKKTYEKYLFPYDLFLAGATFGNDHSQHHETQTNNQSLTKDVEE